MGADHLCFDHGNRYARGLPRVVSLACGLPILPGEGIPKGRTLEYSTPCDGHDGFIHSFEVGL